MIRGGGYPTNQMADGQQDDDFSVNLVDGTSELVPSQDQRWVNESNVGQVCNRQLQGSPIATPNPFQQSSPRPFPELYNDIEDFPAQRSIPVAGSKRQLTYGMSPAPASFGPPRPFLLRHNSMTQNYGDGAGTMAGGSPGNTISSSLAVRQPSMPAGTPFNIASTPYTQWGFTFPNTW